MAEYESIFISADRGGTFTDLFIPNPDGSLALRKVPSSFIDSTNNLESVIRGLIEEINPSRKNDSICLKLGTTVVTNALLEEKGTKPLLLISKGFKDLFKIKDQRRANLFGLNSPPFRQIDHEAVSINERINSAGEILEELDYFDTEKKLLAAKRAGYSSLAIAFLNSWANNAHEEKTKELALKIGFTTVISSNEHGKLIKLIPRGQSALLEAYLFPILEKYKNSTLKLSNKSESFFMQSNGGLIETSKVRATNSILSGPAGGLIAAENISATLNHEQILTVDMGGTSTDVARIGEELPRKDIVNIDGLEFHSDMLDIETVAAGGGSILSFKHGRMQVGPESAGSNPGPACYGWGGPLTVTDANLLLGRILVSDFPKVFGKSRKEEINLGPVKQLFEKLSTHIFNSTGNKFTHEQLALGAIEIAEEKMARALKSVSIDRGFDLREHRLYSFGGASPLHICSLIRRLELKSGLVHPFSSGLSAYGIYLSDKKENISFSFLKELTPENYKAAIKASNERLFKEKPHLLKTEKQNKSKAALSVDLRKAGRDFYLSISAGNLSKPISFEALLQKYKKEIERQFGQFKDDGKIEIVNIKIHLTEVLKTQKIEKESSSEKKPQKKSSRFSETFFDNQSWKCEILDLNELTGSERITGPVLIKGNYFTSFIEPGFFAELNQYGHLEIFPARMACLRKKAKKDPIFLEIFHHLFESVAEQMGEVLRKNAQSLSIKERNDFSCAIFDSQGAIVANAPHVPVHLASMGDTVKDLIAKKSQQLQSGDVFIANSPEAGGSHLPDITAISPVFFDGKVIAFVANRAHHADVGGIIPGSMPAISNSLDEEGVIFEHENIFRQGELLKPKIEEIFSRGPYPCKGINERFEDLRAQTIANQKGIQAFIKIIDNYGIAFVDFYMAALQDNAELALKESLLGFLKGKKEYQGAYETLMDSGARLGVKIKIEAGESPPESVKMKISFEAAKQQKDNLNCPKSVCRASVFYVLRLITNADIPLNEGCLKPVEIDIPKASMLDPRNDAAIVGGNVETSQCLVDILLAALGMSAASQGTMNNFTFADKHGKGAKYYETIGGGSGATKNENGSSGTQIHMTNTPITDPEIIEARFPDVLLRKFGYRLGSGGKGKNIGGNGLTREFEFLNTKIISILSERRKKGSFGLAGGDCGAAGRNILIRPGNKPELLEGKTQMQVNSGDRILIETPGGGGYGKP